MPLPANVAAHATKRFERVLGHVYTTGHVYRSNLDDHLNNVLHVVNILSVAHPVNRAPHGPPGTYDQLAVAGKQDPNQQDMELRRQGRLGTASGIMALLPYYRAKYFHVL